jgi:hypothetical protein
VSGGQWGDWPSLVVWVRSLLNGEIEVELSSTGESQSADADGASRLWESFAAGMLQAMPDHLKGMCYSAFINHIITSLR